jgi:hypothetical protein
VYGIGFIGALVWHWPQADEPRVYLVGVVKALVWAFVVYEAFTALYGRTTRFVRAQRSRALARRGATIDLRS